MKKSKTNKKLASAAAMLLLSAAMLGNSTYAWFTMNKEVQVTNMNVKAVAEEGLLINEVADYNSTYWDDEATANQTATNTALLYPASTANGTTWYHAASKKSNNAAGATSGNVSTNLIGGNSGYETLTGLAGITSMAATASGGTNAAREVMGRAATSTAGYYAHYTYYLKAASGTAISLGTNAGDMNVNIKSVTATPGATNSSELNKALRVGIFMKSSGTFYIYAPITGYTSTYYVAAGTTGTTPIAGTTATVTDLTSLPAAGQDGTPVEVYIWYEGEDANCMSDNATAAALDDIDVDIVFELKAVPTP